MTTVKQIQTVLGVKADSIWGPKSQQALNDQIGLTIISNDEIEQIQALLGVPVDGRWGMLSQSALNVVLASVVHIYKASSFADPADVVAFNRCKAKGETDRQCFAVGDNGIGEFGDITAQDTVPFVAVNHQMMLDRWGSEQGAAHRPVEVTVNGITFQAKVGDRISAPGRIDLNPACAKLVNLQPPFLVPCTWKWL